MNISRIKDIALSTFSDLEKFVKKDNCYNYNMQISTSDDNRIFICFCYIINTNNAIIHEEYDMFRMLNNTRIVSRDFINQYIQNLSDIVYIGLKESSDSDFNLITYYKK